MGTGSPPTSVRFAAVSNELLAPNCKTRYPISLLSFRLRCSPRTSALFSVGNRQRRFPPLARASGSLASASFVIDSTCFPSTDRRHWMVHVEKPPQGITSKADVVDYYVMFLERILGNEKDAQVCIYHASLDTNFGFCCDIDEDYSRKLADLPGVLSVRPDPNYNSERKDYSLSSQFHVQSCSQIGHTQLFSPGSAKHWLVRIKKPGVGVVTKAQIVDYCVQLLSKVLGNENDAQMCIYHISWQSDFGFCCDLDDECARELAGVPGVLAVVPDLMFESLNKDYGGKNVEDAIAQQDPSEKLHVSSKKLFVTGLSFYTSEKTLRAAFEHFGELVEVKVIMDKISRRSKGYAFVEYTTEEAANEALKEMNGKIINGWMIVVDFAKSKPPNYSQRRPRPQA